MTHASEGVQNKSPQRAPFWHDDYFELKTIKSQKTQEELGTSPLTAWKNSDRGPSSEEQDGLEDGWRSAEPVGSDSFLRPIVSAWHHRHLFTNHLVFPSFCELASSPLKPQIPTPFPLTQNGTHTSTACQEASHCLCGAPTS